MGKFLVFLSLDESSLRGMVYLEVLLFHLVTHYMNHLLILL